MPYKMARKSPRRKMVKRKQYKRKVVSASVSPVVKNYVKRMVNLKIEDKIAPNVSQTVTTITPMSATVLNAITLNSVWALSQGTGQGNRIGNTLTPKSWRIKGFFSSPITGTNAPIPTIVKLYIFKQKSGFGVPASSTTFYQNGNSSVAPSLNFNDQMRNVNLDNFTLYTTRVFKVGSAAGFAGATYTASPNNDFRNVCPFNINLLPYQKSSIKYTDTTTTATNSGLYMAYTACYMDGSTYSSANNNISISWEIEGSFEDA